jgi:hypothetical protein
VVILATGGASTEARSKGAITATINQFDNTGIKCPSPDQPSKPITSIAPELLNAHPGANHLFSLVSLPRWATSECPRRCEVEGFLRRHHGTPGWTFLVLPSRKPTIGGSKEIVPEVSPLGRLRRHGKGPHRRFRW